MISLLLKLLVLYCALLDMAQVADRAGQMQDLHQQLIKAAREIDSHPAREGVKPGGALEARGDRLDP